MTRQRRHAPQLDLDELPPGVRAALEAAIAGDDITLTRSGGLIGSLEFHSSVLEGTVVDRPAPRPTPTPIPDGVTVVATTMALSNTARRRLSDGLGADYVVLDLHEAPTEHQRLTDTPRQSSVARAPSAPVPLCANRDHRDRRRGTRRPLPRPSQPPSRRGRGRIPSPTADR